MLEQAERWYGEHTRRTYLIGTLLFMIAGAIVGVFVLPDDWSLLRQLTGGGIMGLWSGFCIFAWRFLFYGDA